MLPQEAEEENSKFLLCLPQSLKLAVFAPILSEECIFQLLKNIELFKKFNTWHNFSRREHMPSMKWEFYLGTQS